MTTTATTPTKRPALFTAGQALLALVVLGSLLLGAIYLAAAGDAEVVRKAAEAADSTPEYFRGIYTTAAVAALVYAVIALGTLVLTLRPTPRRAKLAAVVLCLSSGIFVFVSFIAVVFPFVVPLVAVAFFAAWTFWGPTSVRAWLASRVGMTLRELEGQVVLDTV